MINVWTIVTTGRNAIFLAKCKPLCLTSLRTSRVQCAAKLRHFSRTRCLLGCCWFGCRFRDDAGLLLAKSLSMESHVEPSSAVVSQLASFVRRRRGSTFQKQLHAKRATSASSSSPWRSATQMHKQIFLFTTEKQTQCQKLSRS